MLRGGSCWMLVLSAGIAQANVMGLPAARFVNSRDLTLSFASDNAAAIETARLYVSTDSGRTWSEADAERTGPTMLGYHAEADGRYDFYIVLENAAGVSSPPPIVGSPPHSSAIVDTTPPTLQLHEASVEPDEHGDPALHARLTLIEEHLDPDSVRVFYRDSECTLWTDAGPAIVDDRVLTRVLPRDLPSRIDLRVVATDRAGNRSVGEQLELTVEANLSQPPTSQPATDTAASSQPAATQPAAPEQTAATALPNADETNAASALRQLAARYMSQGNYSLAAARLQDALTDSPEDADLLVDLGSALYRSRRIDEAGEYFQHALNTAPDHTGALEGLALVEVTRRRYADARGHLRRLVELEPASARSWLHLGDVEHRLGNHGAADDAWQKVLDVDAEISLRKKAQERLQLFGPPKGESRP